MTTRSQHGIFRPKQLHHATKFPLLEDVEPTSVSKALSDPRWLAAMSEEFTTLLKHDTWDLTPAPANTNIIGCKWVF